MDPERTSRHFANELSLIVCMCQERLECVNDFREKIMLINVAEINANIN